jgi:hypothetical protein
MLRCLWIDEGECLDVYGGKSFSENFETSRRDLKKGATTLTITTLSKTTFGIPTISIALKNATLRITNLYAESSYQDYNAFSPKTLKPQDMTSKRVPRHSPS